MNLYQRLACLVLISWTLIAVSGCGNRDNRSSANPAAEPAAEVEPAPVEIQPVQTGSIAEYIETTSNVYADSRVVVYPKTSGQVVRIDVQEGDRVKEGQILAVIDDESSRLRVRQLEVTLKQAREKLERTRQLYENRMVSREAYEDANYRFEDADVALKIAGLELDNTRIKCPIGGIVVSRSIRTGDLINAANPTFEIIDPESLQIDVFLPEREVGRLRAGMKALVYPDSLPGREFGAMVNRINPAVDVKTGTVKVTLTFETVSEDIISGMFVRIRILVEQREQAVLLPKKALIRRQDENRVFVADPDGNAELRLLTLGIENLHTYEVLDGLERGERLVIVGQHTLEPGRPLKILEAPILTPPAEAGSDSEGDSAVDSAPASTDIPAPESVSETAE